MESRQGKSIKIQNLNPRQDTRANRTDRDPHETDTRTSQTNLKSIKSSRRKNHSAEEKTCDAPRARAARAHCHIKGETTRHGPHQVKAHITADSVSVHFLHNVHITRRPSVPPPLGCIPPGHAHGSLSLPSTYHVHAHLALDGAVAPPLLTNAQSVSVQALISVPYERGRERVPSGLRRPARRAPRTPASLPHLLSPRASGSFHGLPPPPPGASLPPLHVVTALRLLYRAYCIAPTASCCCRRPPPPRAARRRRWRAPARSAPRLR